MHSHIWQHQHWTTKLNSSQQKLNHTKNIDIHIVERIIIIISYLIFETISTANSIFDNCFFFKRFNWLENALTQHWPLKNRCVTASLMFMIHYHGCILHDIFTHDSNPPRCISWQELDTVWVNTWVRQAGSASTGNVVIPLPSPPDSNFSYTPINTLDITDTASHWSGSWLTCNPGFWLV